MAFQTYRVEQPRGVNFTQEPAQLDPAIWDEAEQVAFRYGVTEKVSGYEEGFGKTFNDNAAIPLAFLPLRDDTGQFYWWSYATTDPDGTGHIYRIQSVDNHQDVTPSGGITVGRQWTGDSINAVPFFTTEKPYAWDGSSFEPISKFPNHVTAKTIRTYGSHMIALNFDTANFDPLEPGTSDYYKKFSGWVEGKHQNAIWWSSEVIGKNLEVSWADADPEKESGWNFLGGAGGAIMDGKVMRESFIIYRETSIWQMTYVGGVSVFAFKELFNDVGALGLDCITNIDGWHFVVGQSDVYMHNGVQKQSVADGVIRKKIFASIDPAHIEKVFVLTRYEDKEAWVCVPEAGTNNNGTCNLAYVYNWAEKHWSIRRLPNILCGAYTILDIAEGNISWTKYGDTKKWEEINDSWQTSFFKYNSSEWGLAFCGQSDDGTKGYVYTSIKENTANGANFKAQVQKKWMTMGDSTIVKTTNRIFPLVRDGEVEVYVGGSNVMGASPVWKYAGIFDPNTRDSLGCTATGKYLHVKFVIPETSRAKIKGYYLEYTMTGLI